MMNEENNRKGPGVFYAVVGVATLVVAIIGATFAYFSAQATATGDNVTGGTNNDLASALSVTVTRVNKTPTNAASIDLVPANIDGTTETVNNAVKANCEANGYTGCHLYKIEAKSKQTVANASILLSSLTVDSKAKPKRNIKQEVLINKSFNKKYLIKTSENNYYSKIIDRMGNNIIIESGQIISISDISGIYEE